MGNPYFRNRSLYKYAGVVRGQDGVEVKRMLDLVLVKKYTLRYVQQDVRAVRGLGRGLSDHHVVLCKVRLLEQLLRGERWWLGLAGLEARN